VFGVLVYGAQGARKLTVLLVAEANARGSA
jgi:hypothetical protein